MGMIESYIYSNWNVNENVFDFFSTFIEVKVFPVFFLLTVRQTTLTIVSKLRRNNVGKKINKFFMIFCIIIGKEISILSWFSWYIILAMLGVFYLKLNAVYVCNGTMDLSRNSVFNVKVGQNKETQLFLFIYCSNSNSYCLLLNFY